MSNLYYLRKTFESAERTYLLAKKTYSKTLRINLSYHKDYNSDDFQDLFYISRDFYCYNIKYFNDCGKFELTRNIKHKDDLEDNLAISYYIKEKVCRFLEKILYKKVTFDANSHFNTAYFFVEKMKN